jgi:hypothetical protein
MTARELPVAPAACSLDAGGQAEQGARYEALADSIESLDVVPGRVAVRLGAGLDRTLLAETIEVERGCCPFLTIDYDEGARTLTIDADSEHQAVLDGIAASLRN